jgi:hypothetical protein
MTAMERELYMGQSSTRVAEGPEDTKAVDKIRQVIERRDNWPYPWSYPPPNSQRRNPSGFVVMPAQGTSAIALAFQVPQGFQFDLVKIMFAAVTTGMVLVGNPGDYAFTVNRNTPSTGSAPQGSPLADFQNVPFNFGSPAHGPIDLARAENFGPTDIIRVYINNVTGTAGAPNFGVALLEGWQRKA